MEGTVAHIPPPRPCNPRATTRVVKLGANAAAIGQNAKRNVARINSIRLK